MKNLKKDRFGREALVGVETDREELRSAIAPSAFSAHSLRLVLASSGHPYEFSLQNGFHPNVGENKIALKLKIINN